MRKLHERIGTLGGLLIRRRTEALALKLAELLPQAEVRTRGPGELEVAGRALRKRWLHDASLRFLARFRA